MHVDLALARLQKDRVSTTLSSASYHLKLTATALARISYLSQEVWHSTSTVYNQYRHILEKGDNTKPPLTYRRISELLTELENMGLVTSHTSSKGRKGYGKIQHDKSISSMFNSKNYHSTLFNNKKGLSGLINSMNEDSWNKFVGLK
jgi:Cdc6-like AAA superfamily ATPase